MSLANDTIALNTAKGGALGGPATNAPGIGSGGGVATSLYPFVYSLPPLATIINTIVAQNSATLNADVDGVFRSLGSNLIGDASGATASFNATTGDFTGTKAAPLSPNLDPLGNYGGPTQTFRLRTGSLAIDRGNNSVTTGALKLTTDQRGQPRLVGTAVDIGAFEAPQPSLDKSYTVAQGGTLTVATANGLLTGMYNPLGRTVTVQLVPKTGPATGALTLSANGTFTYKPPAAFFGTVSFQFYEFVDGQITGIFTATINVTKTPGRLI